jgi:hypothetical protein
MLAAAVKLTAELLDENAVPGQLFRCWAADAVRK